MRKSNIITAILSGASLVWIAAAHAETEQAAGRDANSKANPWR